MTTSLAAMLRDLFRIGDASTETQTEPGVLGSLPSSFYEGMAVYMLVLVLLGFWPTYFGRLISGSGPDALPVPGTPWILHLHAVVFGGWTVLLLIQAGLVDRGQLQRHMRVGRYGVLGGGLLIVVGIILVLLVEYHLFVSEGRKTWVEVPLSAFVFGPGVQVVVFTLLLGLGYLYRSAPDAHKRYMLFATIAILPAATSRMDYLVGPYSMEIMHASLIAPVFIFDWRSRGRPHFATLVGAGAVVLVILMLTLWGLV